MGEMTRHARVIEVFRQRNRYQFGQPKSDRVSNSGCTDTCIQLIVKISKNLNVSLNKVRENSGAADNAPMKADQALKALRSFGMPYELRIGITADEILDIVHNKGPVILAVMYWSYPQWKGYKYLGKILDGKSRNNAGQLVHVGFSRPLKRSGRTQTTFREGHAVLVGTDEHVEGKRVAIIRDPNHNSSLRPEKPAYDIINMAQLKRMLKSWPVNTVALVPIRPVVN